MADWTIEYETTRSCSEGSSAENMRSRTQVYKYTIYGYHRTEVKKDLELYAKFRSMIADYLVKAYAHEAATSKLLALHCSEVARGRRSFVWCRTPEQRYEECGSTQGCRRGPICSLPLLVVICKQSVREVDRARDHWLDELAMLDAFRKKMNEMIFRDSSQ